MNKPADHLSTESLLDYWLHDSDAAATEAADAHLMHCDECGQRVDELIALGDGVRTAFRAGAILAVASDGLLQRLAAEGLRIREYRLPPGGSANCTVAPDDDMVVSRLEVRLQGVERLDLLTRVSIEPGVQHRLEDVPFDPGAGALLVVQKLAELRRMPAYTTEVTLLAVTPGDTRELGHYTFVHRPWPGHPS